ncbi:MAG TPA: hypothetical protein VF816_09800 [Rhodocyclaceae bacterium]
MHAHHFAVLVTLATSSGVAAAHFVAPAAALTPQGGFIKTAVFVAKEPAAPIAAVPAAAPSCAGSTFSELGHGHPDVASAGFIAAHCAPRAEAASPDAGLAPAR